MFNGFRRDFRRRSVRLPSRPPTGRWVPRHPNGAASMPHGRWNHQLRAFHHTASLIAHVQSDAVQNQVTFGLDCRGAARAAAIASAERRSASEVVAGTSGLRPGRSAGHQSALLSHSSSPREWSVPDIGSSPPRTERGATFTALLWLAGSRRAASTAAGMVDCLSRACLFIEPPASARVLPCSVRLIFCVSSPDWQQYGTV